MRHFIELRKNKKVRDGYIDCVEYYYNNFYNIVGDFSYYYRFDNYWYKRRVYRGRYVYSKKPHRSDSNDDEWYYEGRWYNNYEAYMMALIE